MGFLVGLIVTAVGFILALAVHPTHPGSVNINTVGWIMVVVGLIALFADLIFWSSRGPGYARRTYVEQGPGYGSRWGYGRRRVIEEEEGGGPRCPGY
jgi:multisubunit Na+/H+ antiporter MnhB subunit